MVHIKNIAAIALCLLVLDFAEATKEFTATGETVGLHALSAEAGRW